MEATVLTDRTVTPISHSITTRVTSIMRLLGDPTDLRLELKAIMVNTPHAFLILQAFHKVVQVR